MTTSAKATWFRTMVWLGISSAGLAQLGLLFAAVFARIGYGFDLEWMEGGLLVHAERIAEGRGIYVEPSIEFIPYLYTPLYPGLIAGLGSIFGISYQLGRIISVLSIFAILALIAIAIIRDADKRDRSAALTGSFCAAGLFAAVYPWVDGWYDLVRADTLFLAMVIAGLLAVRLWARHPEQARVRIAGAAALLALSFFCKQTGILYVAAGGAVVLVLNWRVVWVYVASAGAIGLGGTWILQKASGGWFWTYVFEVHQAHDFNMDRFYQSFENILWHFPAMTIVVGLALVAVGITAVAKRRLPASAGALLLWSFVFAVSVLVGALGWGTQWAHFNAYMPAMATGAIAAGASLPALSGVARLWRPDAPPFGSFVAAALAGIALSWTLYSAWWSPSVFTPTSVDQASGEALIKYLKALDGEVWVPSHPWYARLAGKRAWVHRMGVKDVTYGNKWRVAELDLAIRTQAFDAIVLDTRDIYLEQPMLASFYKRMDHIPNKARPRLFSGAKVVPESVWIPIRPEKLPAGVTALLSFESGKYDNVSIEGSAWGLAPVTQPLRDQGPVRGYGGKWYATSMHGGDTAIGKLTSSQFVIAGEKISLLVAGGTDKATLRAELVVDGKVVRTTTPKIASEGMERVEWNVGDLQGRKAAIVLVDEATGSWGHINVDEVWMWRAQ